MPVQVGCMNNNLCKLLIGSIFCFCCIRKFQAFCFSMAQPLLQNFLKNTVQKTINTFQTRILLKEVTKWRKSYMKGSKIKQASSRSISCGYYFRTVGIFNKHWTKLVNLIWIRKKNYKVLCRLLPEGIKQDLMVLIVRPVLHSQRLWKIILHCCFAAK